MKQPRKVRSGAKSGIGTIEVSHVTGGHNVVGRPGRPRRADRNIRMPAHAAGERSNVTISKDPQESELPAPGDFSTRVLKSSGAGSALSCRPFGKSQKTGPKRSPIPIPTFVGLLQVPCLYHI